MIYFLIELDAPNIGQGCTEHLKTPIGYLWFMDYFVIDIETAPLNQEAYEAATEDDRKKNFLNPIASKIVSIGMRYDDKNKVFLSFNDEKSILEDFWSEWSDVRRGSFIPVVGFNICDFDLPMLVGRSFVNNVVISPFLLNDIIDLRQKLTAYNNYMRGKLKEYANLIGLEVIGEDGSQVANWVKNNMQIKVRQYLERDLEITDAVFKRAEDLNILKIKRW